MSDPVKELVCECGARVPNTSKYRGRFKRRHPKLCQKRKEFAKQLAEDVKSVEDEPKEEES